MTRWCVIYIRGMREHQSPWFTNQGRAGWALEVLRRRYGAAVLYRD